MTFGIKESGNNSINLITQITLETCRLVEKLKYFDGRQRISREAQKRNAEKAQRLTQDFLFRAILVKLVNKMIRFVKLVDFDPHYLFLTVSFASFFYFNLFRSEKCGHGRSKKELRSSQSFWS